MGSSFAEANVHVDEVLADPWVDVVRKVISGIEGVQEVDLPEDRPHHLMVKFDPGRTSPRLIQNELAYMGYHTEIIAS